MLLKMKIGCKKKTQKGFMIEIQQNEFMRQMRMDLTVIKELKKN